MIQLQMPSESCGSQEDIVDRSGIFDNINQQESLAFYFI